MPVKPIQSQPRRVKSHFENRKTVAVVFLLSVAVSLGFWLKTELPVFWQKATSPLMITGGPQPEKFDPSLVLEEIKSLTHDLRGVYGVYVYQLDDKNEYGLHQNEIFPAASLMKLPVMLLVYQEVEKGELKLDDYRELVKLMGQHSDNVAYNKLVKYFGKEKIQQLIDSLGMEKTFIAKDDTTPADIGLFFRKLYQDNLVNQVNQGELLSFLTDTIFEDRIPAGLPASTRVAHKIGTEIGSYSDAGIVFAPPTGGPNGGPTGGFVLVIMSKNARESEAKEILPKIAATVWEFEDKK